jgi:hypothetical protein
MFRTKFAAYAALLLAAAACSGDVTSPVEPGPAGPAQTISDAAHAGAVPGFYFLPPMVPNPSYSGTFDGGLQPRVEICELAGPVCGPVIAQYTTTSGTGGTLVQVGSSSYQVNWHTNQFNLDPAKTYRISVYVDAFRLGFADVDVVNSGKELKNVDTQQYIALQDGRTLPIKFRIETGIAGQVVVTPDSASIPVGGTQQFTATVLDLHGNPLAVPVTWSSSNPGVATVDGSGLATGVSVGQTTITATAQGASGSATLTVFNPNTPPVANPDTFQAIGNVTVPVAAPGVLANDTDGEGNTLSAIAGTFPTAAGGTVTINADGSFSYLSAPGFIGQDGFEYTVTDGTDSATGTVTVVSTYRVWYVDNSAAAPGDGRDASPFTTLKAAEAASAAGETIFLLYGNGSTDGYDEGIVLKTGQSLTGQGVPANVTATLNGQTVVLLAAGSAPTVTRSSAGTTVAIAANNVLQGFDVESTAGAGIAGTGFGTLTVGSISVDATGGPALDLSSGDVFGTFEALSSSNSTGAGIHLLGIGGSFSAADGTIAGAATAGVDVTGGAGVFSYGGDIVSTGPLAVFVANRTGGALIFGGTIASTGNGIGVQNNSGGTIAFTGSGKTLSTGVNAGVRLLNNAGATISFAGGGLAIATTGGTGFEATGGGTVTVTGAGNTIVSAGGTAVQLDAIGSGATGISFQSVSATGGTSAIVITDLSGAGFQVTGSGAAPASGGTLRNTTGDAVVVSNAIVELSLMSFEDAAGEGVEASGTGSVTLDRTVVVRTGGHGIRATGAVGLTLLGARVANAGNADNEAGILLTGYTGTAIVDGSVLEDAAENLVRVENTGVSGTLRVRNGSTLRYSAATGAFASHAIFAVPSGSASIAVDVENSTFTNIPGSSVLLGGAPVGSSGASTLRFVSNTVNSTVPGKGGSVLALGQASTSTSLTVTDNTFTGAGGNGVVNADAKDAATIAGRIERNAISNAAAVAIVVSVEESATNTALVDANQISNAGSDGIQVANFGGAGASSLNAVITNNVVNGHNLNPAAAFLAGITVFGFEDATCLALGGNTVSGTLAGYEGVYLEHGGGTFSYEEVPNTAATGAVTPAYVLSENAVGSAAVNGAVNLSNGASCARP